MKFLDSLKKLCCSKSPDSGKKVESTSGSNHGCDCCAHDHTDEKTKNQ